MAHQIILKNHKTYFQISRTLIYTRKKFWAIWKKKKIQIFVVIFATLIFASWLHCVATPSNFWLQRTLENFLRESQTFPRYVTSSPNLGLSNGTKIITCGSLEKNRHAYFKKRYPHLPFVSYFSKYKSRIISVQYFHSRPKEIPKKPTVD